MKRLACALSLLLAGIAQAQTSTVDSLRWTATFNNIGGRIFYTGDADSDATCRLLVKRSGAASFDTCIAPVNVRWANPKFFAGSALWCGQDTAYVLRFEYTDPDGATWARDTTITTTGPYARGGTTGKQVWVSPGGSNANSGLTSSLPKKNFSNALSVLSAGDQLVLMPGVYYDTMVVTTAKSGTYANPTSIIGQPGAIVTGADSTLNRTTWDSVTVSPGVKVYRKVLSPAKWPRVVVADSIRRCWPYGSMKGLVADSAATGDGFYTSPAGDTLYVRLNGDNPNGRTMHVSQRNYLFIIQSAFTRIDSLEFRCVGTGRDVGISYGAVTITGEADYVRNSTFYNVSRPCVNINTLFDGNQARRCLIEQNTFRDWRIGHAHTGPMGDYWGNGRLFADGFWTEMSIMCPTIIIEEGFAHVIRNNTAIGMADGFVRGTVCGADANRCDDVDIYDNDIRDYSTDVFEPDCWTGTNCRIYRNVVRGGQSFINNAITFGPTFIYQNLAIDNNVFIKPSQNASAFGDTAAAGYQVNIGYTFFINNTHWSLRNGAVGIASTQQDRYQHWRLYNNILMAANGSGFWCIWDYGYPAPATIKNIYNWNAYDASYIGAGNNFAAHQWAGSATGFSDSTTFRTTMGAEGNGFIGYNQATLLGYADTLNRIFYPAQTARVVGKQHIFADRAGGITNNYTNHATPGFVPVAAIGAFSTDAIRPDDPSNLAVTGTGAKGVSLTFTPTGTDSLAGCASTYEVRYSTGGSINDGNWASATSAVIAPVNCTGVPQSVYVGGLSFSTQYWFAVRVTDAAGNPSAASNSPTTTTLKRGDW